MCEECKIFVCKECIEYKLYEKIDILIEVNMKLFQYREIINNIKGEVFYKRYVLLVYIKDDLKIY